MRTQKILSLLVTVLLFGCASTEGVLSEFDETADFENYSTFVLCIDDMFVENVNYPEYDNNSVRQLIGDAIEGEMIARDHETNVLEPELQAGFEIILERKEATFESCETEGQYEYWRETTLETIIYTEETLVVYVSDMDKNQIIWQASKVCDMNRSQKKLPQYIAELVEQLFNEYPKVPMSAL